MIDDISLKTFDLFQITVPISYKNNYTYQSNLGGILTIISFLIIIIYSLIKISILFDRTVFNILSTEYHDLGGSIDLTSTPILLQLLDKTGNGMEYDTKLYSFSVTYYETIFEDISGEMKRTNKQTKLEIERCDKLKKFIPALGNFSNYDLTKFMCIKPNQSIILYGMSDDLNSNYKSLGIKIDKCKGNNCYNSKLIEEIMENSIFTVSYLGYATNFTNVIIRKNIVNKIYTKHVTLSQNLIKKITFGFSKCKLILYDNMIINHKIEFNYFAYKNFFEDFFIQNNTNSYTLAYFYFNYNGFMVEHTKKINGLGSVILNICTIFNIVVLIFRNINNYYGTKLLFSDIYLNFLLKNGRLQKMTKIPSKKEVNASINRLLDKSFNNNLIVGNKSNNNIDNNINLVNFRNYSSFKEFNSLDKNKINKKKSDYFISRSDLLKFYFYPYCLMKRNKKLSQIKEQINVIFSIENFFSILQISNSSHNVLYEQILKYISSENYRKTVSKDNELRSNINLKSLLKNDNELHLEHSELK